MPVASPPHPGLPAWAGTLDLVLAHPVSRASLALQRFAAFLFSVVLIGVALLVVLVALTGPARLEGISVGDYAAMHLHLTLFAALFGSVGFGIGAATGRRGLALGVGAGVAVFGFAANGILPQVEGLEWVKGYSPFNWLNGGVPLVNGVQTGNALIMTGQAGWRMRLDGERAARVVAATHSRQAILGIRPEHLALSEHRDGGDGMNRHPGRIWWRENRAPRTGTESDAVAAMMIPVASPAMQCTVEPSPCLHTGRMYSSCSPGRSGPGS